jgi:thioredoxin
MNVVVTCPTCGVRNRIDEARALAQQPKCGRCGTPLELPAQSGSHKGKVVEINDDTLDQVLRSAGDKPVLVDAWAAWCGPCRAIAPTIEQLAAEANGRYVVGKLDVDSNPQTTERFDIASIPALLFFKRGKLVDRLVGLQPKQAIATKLASHV